METAGEDGGMRMGQRWEDGRGPGGAGGGLGREWWGQTAEGREQEGDRESRGSVGAGVTCLGDFSVDSAAAAAYKQREVEAGLNRAAGPSAGRGTCSIGRERRQPLRGPGRRLLTHLSPMLCPVPLRLRPALAASPTLPTHPP